MTMPSISSPSATSTSSTPWRTPKTGNHADAEDITQETFLKAYHSLDTLHDPRRIGHWLATIARRTGYSLFRSAERRRKREEGVRESIAAPPEDMEGREMAEEVRRHLAELAPEQREVLMLRYYAGKSVKEVAVVLNIEANTAAKRLQRAREALGERLLSTLGESREDEKRTAKRLARIAGAIALTQAPWKSAAAASAATATVGSMALLKLCGALAAAVLVGLGAWNAYVVRDADNAAERDRGSVLAEASAPEVLPASDASQETVEKGLGALSTNAQATDPPPPEADAAPKGGAITGRVYDEDTDKGIAGVDVHVYARVDVNAIARQTTVQTDAKGHYRFEGLAEKTYSIHHEIPQGYPPHAHDHQWPKTAVKTGEEIGGIDFALRRGIPVSGTVVDKNGAPLIGALVCARPVQSEARSARGYAEQDGTFRLSLPGDATRIRLQPSKDGFALAPQGPYDVPPEGLADIRLVMAPESVITGQLIDPDGKPLAGYQPHTWPRPYQFNALHGINTSTTDEKGRFRVGGLFPASWHFQRAWLRKEHGYQDCPLASPVLVELGEGETIGGITLVLGGSNALTLSGRVTSTAGKAISNARVTASSRLGSSLECRTDGQGRYSLDRLTGSDYSVTASHQHFGRAVRRDIPAGSQHVDFVLEPLGGVSGQVLDARTKKPITDFKVNGQLVQNAEGRFHIADVRPGSSTVRVEAAGYAPKASDKLTVSPGRTTEDVVIELEAGAVIEGVVFSPDGQPLRDAKIFLDEFPSSQVVISEYANATSGTEGAFTLTSIPPSAKTLWAYHPRYAPVEVPVPWSQQPDIRMEITMGAPATLSGTAHIDGVRLAAVSVQVGETSPAVYEDRTNDEGSFRITGLAGGEVNLEIHRLFQIEPPFYERRMKRTVQIKPGADNEFEIDLTPWDTRVEGRVTKDGAPLNARTVFVQFYYRESNGDWDRFTAYPDAEGYYALNGTKPGPAMVQVRASGVSTPPGGPREYPVTVQEGQATTLDLDLTE